MPTAGYCAVSDDDDLSMSNSNVDGAWVASHFTISSQEMEIPSLLQKLGDEIELLGPVNILDITFCQETEGPNLETRATVYYTRV